MAGPHWPHMFDPFAEARQHRFRADKRLRVAPDHHRECARFGARGPTTDRSISKGHVDTGEPRRNTTGSAGISRGAVEQEGTGLESGHQSVGTLEERFDL